ncbi:MAG: hypothetical protein NZL89_07080, partial [Leptospiraceae bacterium]|nr:hypothetical protein [Leptospiraceae bacterium]
DLNRRMGLLQSPALPLGYDTQKSVSLAVDNTQKMTLRQGKIDTFDFCYVFNCRAEATLEQNPWLK